MAQNDLVIKNKLLVNISGNATFVQRKLFNTLLHKVFDELGNYKKDYFTVNVKEIAGLMGYGSRLKYTDFRRDCFALMRTIIVWNILEKGEELEELDASVLMSSVKLKDGIIRFEFPKSLRERLVENKQYIKLSLTIQNKFTSKYSLILYELAKEFYRERDEKGETPWIEIESLRTLIGLENGEYREYKALKRDVLLKAIKEINKVSDLIISFVDKKESRKVSALKFIIEKNPQPLDLGMGSTAKIRDKSKPTSQQTDDITKQLEDVHINNKKITQWQINYTPDYLQSKIDLTYQYLRERKIKTSPSGFLVRAVEEDFGGKTIDIDTLLEQEALEARKINLETFSLSPIDFHTKEEFQARVEQLKSQYYNPRWSERDMTTAEEIWSLNLG